MALVACTGSGGPKPGFSGGSSTKYKVILQTPEPAQYRELVDVFVDTCVLESGGSAAATPKSPFYRFETGGMCVMYLDSIPNDDTVIAGYLTERLKQIDPGFNYQRGTILGAAWMLGDGTKWSAKDGKPLIAAGRSSAKSIFALRNVGAKY